MKKKLLFLSMYCFVINLHSQTTFNNFVPDRLLGDTFSIRNIDLNNDGTFDFRFHYAVEGTNTIVYLETLEENQILVHNPGFETIDPLVTSTLLTSNPYDFVAHPTLTQVNQELVGEYLNSYDHIAYWTSSNSVNKNGLMISNNPSYLVNFSVSSSPCYDYYYCRIKMPGISNYLYGFIQAFGYQASNAGGVLFIGGTGCNTNLNQTAIIDPSCVVSGSYEPGPQTPELSTNQFVNDSSISIMAVADQIQIFNNGTMTIEKMQFSLFSITGALISKSTHSISSNSQINVDKNGLAKGIYLVELSWGDYKYFKKLVL